jgi:GH43 family beta-xylosidase
LRDVASTVVYFPTGSGTHSQNIWAPELHRLDGKWYMYYTAGSGPDSTQRLWVLENSDPDPSHGAWVDKGRVYTSTFDHWAIDGTVLDDQGSRYFLWSGRPDLSVQNQNIYIAKMSNPWTLEGPVVLLSKPELSWEVQGGPVNEGPEVLRNPQGQVLITYSASGCWTDDYNLGLLVLRTGGDPLQTSDWTKKPQPVLVKKPQNSAFGPGHNAFFESPDGTEDWIIYHANTKSGDGCGEKRNIRIQRFTWKADGTPDFGEPAPVGVKMQVPSGE